MRSVAARQLVGGVEIEVVQDMKADGARKRAKAAKGDTRSRAKKKSG